MIDLKEKSVRERSPLISDEQTGTELPSVFIITGFMSKLVFFHLRLVIALQYINGFPMCCLTVRTYYCLNIDKFWVLPYSS